MPSALLALETLAVFFFSGLGMVAITMFLPSLLLLAVMRLDGIAEAALVMDSDSLFAVAFGLASVVHWYRLCTDAQHVAVYHFFWHPVRRLLVPVTLWVARIESIREQTPTIYRKIPR